MFLALALLSVVAALLLLLITLFNQALAPYFFAMLFSSAFCFMLARMDQKISSLEYDVAKLKSHLGIKEDENEEP